MNTSYFYEVLMYGEYSSRDVYFPFVIYVSVVRRIFHVAAAIHCVPLSTVQEQG